MEHQTHFIIPTLLENERALLYPLQESDFSELYALASDPLVWEQHPVKDRWQEPVFRNFFDRGMESRGAFRIVDKASGQTAGSSRFYDYDPEQQSIYIGYTFYGRRHWGKGLNPSVKALMLDYAFRFADTVHFHVGAYNIRSQTAVMRLGAVKTGELEMPYAGEISNLNFIYTLSKAAWQAQP
jgi:RimJ/RimL family protein N-acetyltransferase